MIMEKKAKAAFEAGIKLGALYHQWVGTPISPQTAGSVEKAIESAVGLQPFVDGITVKIDTSQMVLNAFGYSELSGKMFDVKIRTKVGNATCHAQLKVEEDYPMMKIIELI